MVDKGKGRSIPVLYCFFLQGKRPSMVQLSLLPSMRRKIVIEHLAERRISDEIEENRRKILRKRQRPKNMLKSLVSEVEGLFNKVATEIMPGTDDIRKIRGNEVYIVSRITEVSDLAHSFDDLSAEVLHELRELRMSSEQGILGNRKISSVFEEIGMILIEMFHGIQDRKESPDGRRRDRKESPDGIQDRKESPDGSFYIYQISSVLVERGCFQEIFTEIIHVIEECQKSNNSSRSKERLMYIFCCFEEKIQGITFGTCVSRNTGKERKDKRKSVASKEEINTRSQTEDLTSVTAKENIFEDPLQEISLVISIKYCSAYDSENKEGEGGLLMEVYRSNNEIKTYSRKHVNDVERPRMGVSEVVPIIETCRSNNEKQADDCETNENNESFGRSIDGVKDIRKKCKRARYEDDQESDSLHLLVGTLPKIIHGMSVRDSHPISDVPKRESQDCSLVEVYSYSKEKRGSGKDEENSGSNKEASDTSYLPGMDDSAALRCLAFLPVTEHWRLSMVSRRHKDLVRSSLLLKLRQEYKIVQQWICIYTSGNNGWAAFDPKQNTWRNLRHADVDPNFDLSDKESLSAGSHLLWLGREAFNFACYRYDLISNSWDRGPPMVNSRCLFASASCGQYAFVAGGFTVCGMLFNVINTAERYDSVKGIWEPLPSMATPRHKCSGFFMDGKFYVIGGKSTIHEPLTSGEEYDPEKNSWRTIEDMYPIPPCTPSFEPSPPLVAVAGNELYGLDSSSNLLKVYEKQSNTWKVLGPVPVRADFCNGWGLAFKALGDEIFVIGGHRVSDEEREGVAVFSWRPSPGASAPEWKLVNSRVTGTGNFLFNCAVMAC